MTSIGPLSARAMLKLQVPVFIYSTLLYSGAIGWLPNLPLMGGDAFTKFEIGPPNWQIAYLICAFLLAIGLSSAVFGYIGSDYGCILACQATPYPPVPPRTPPYPPTPPTPLQCQWLTLTRSLTLQSTRTTERMSIHIKWSSHCNLSCSMQQEQPRCWGTRTVTQLS